MNTSSTATINVTLSRKMAEQLQARFMPLGKGAMKLKGLLLAVAALGGLFTGFDPAWGGSVYTPYTFTTLAGVAPGSADGTGTAARFNGPNGVAVDSAGNVYVADDGNNTIRKVTCAGVVTTLAGLVGSLGSADGTGSAAQFSDPRGVAVDSAGNVYVADLGNNTIRKGYPAYPMILSSGPGFGFNSSQFAFTLTGPAGKLVIVEASTDLAGWLPVWTNTFAGSLNFSDPQSGIHSNRFYRAQTP
jgi:NHL repeat